MAYLCFILVIGFISTSFGQNALSQNEVIYVDPFMAQKCAAKGIQYEQLNNAKGFCIREAGQNYIRNRGGVNDPVEAMTAACKIRDEIDSCVETFIDGAKACYDTDSQKKQVENSKVVVNAVFDYMCQNDAAEMIAVFGKLSNMKCIGKIGEVADLCMSQELQGISQSRVNLQNEDTCRAAFEIGKCFSEPMKDCNSREAYDFISGIFDASMDSSECSKYNIPRLNTAVERAVFGENPKETHTHAGGHGFTGRSEMLFVDPFVVEKCQAKNIDFQELYLEKLSCIQTAIDNKIEIMKGWSNPPSRIIVNCRIGSEIDSCTHVFIESVKNCYDTKTQKNEVEKLADIFNAVFQYTCHDDGKQVEDAYNNNTCLRKVGEGSTECMNGLQKVKRSTTHLVNEEVCSAAFELGRCLIEPLKDCPSRQLYNIFRDYMDLSMNASYCSQYTNPRITSAAVTPTCATYVVINFSIAFLLLLF